MEENKQTTEQSSPWERNWIKKPVQAVIEFVDNSVKAIKEPWEKTWKSKDTVPSPTPKKPAVEAPRAFDMDYYIQTTAKVESGNNPNAAAKTSSAKGLYQFTAKTWNEMVNALDLPYTLKDRTDPKKSEEVMRAFTQRNVEKAKSDLGREPTHTEAYMYHFLGNSASRFLKASGNDEAYKHVTPAQARANKSVFFDKEGRPKTVNDILDRYNERFK